MPEPALLKLLSLRIDSFVYGEGEKWTGCAGNHTYPLSFKYSISYPGRFVKGFYKNNLNILSIAKEKSLSGGCLERDAPWSISRLSETPSLLDFRHTLGNDSVLQCAL